MPGVLAYTYNYFKKLYFTFLVSSSYVKVSYSVRTPFSFLGWGNGRPLITDSKLLWKSPAGASWEPLPILPGVHGTQRCSTCYQRSKVNTSPVTNLAVYSGDLFPWCTATAEAQTLWEQPTTIFLVKACSSGWNPWLTLRCLRLRWPGMWDKTGRRPRGSPTTSVLQKEQQWGNS